MPAPAAARVHPKIRVAAVSIAANGGLVTIELGVALATGSLAVLADAFHSGVDLTGSVVALAGIRMALRDADRRHAYGYGRYENAAALIQFVLIAIIGVTVIEEAVRRYIFGFRVEVTPVALAVVLATILFDGVLYRYIARRSQTLGSSALEADSYHFGTDAVGKVAVLVGIGAAYLGFPVMDLVGAVAIALAFLVAAFLMGRRNLQILVDASPPQDFLEAVRDAAQSVKGVVEIHSLRGRSSGRRVLLDLAVHVSPDLSLERAHEIAHSVELAIKDRIPSVAEVVVHAEPAHHERTLDRNHPA